MSIGSKKLAAFSGAGNPKMPFPTDVPASDGAPDEMADDGDDGSPTDMDAEDDKAMAAEVAQQVMAGERDPLLDAAMADADLDALAQAGVPEWVEGEENVALWHRAEEAVEPEENVEQYGDPATAWCIVAHVYERLGGEVPGADGGEGEADEMGGEDRQDDPNVPDMSGVYDH